MNDHNVIIGDGNLYPHGVGNYMHRYYNEIPSIKKQVAKINTSNNEVMKLLTQREAFIGAPVNITDISSSGKRRKKDLPPLISGIPPGKRFPVLKSKEGFKPGHHCEKLMMTILWIILIAMVGTVLFLYYRRKKDKLLARASRDYADDRV